LARKSGMRLLTMSLETSVRKLAAVMTRILRGSFMGERFQVPGAREERSSLAPGTWNLRN